MNYGHADSQAGDAFFASDANILSKNANNFEAENNVNLSNDTPSWGSSPERDHRNIGNKAIGSRGEEYPNSDGFSSEPQLGKIIDPNMPPDIEGKAKEDPSKIIEASFDRTVIKTDDRLSSGAVKEIDAAITKLDQNGNISDFYDAVRDAMEINLDNSYGRKLAA